MAPSLKSSASFRRSARRHHCRFDLVFMVFNRRTFFFKLTSVGHIIIDCSMGQNYILCNFRKIARKRETIHLFSIKPSNKQWGKDSFRMQLQMQNMYRDRGQIFTNIPKEEMYLRMPKPLKFKPDVIHLV